MANAPPSNLLDEALDGRGAAVFSSSSHGGYGSSGGRMVLVEDCVETSGAFVVHHLLKRSLSPHSSDVVVFLSFAHPFSHYDRILRKMGCNLNVQRDSKRLLFFDMLISDRLDIDRLKTSEDKLISLYGEIQKAVEVCQSHEGRQHVTLIIDDVSLMEVDVNGSSNLVMDFLGYCNSLTAQFGCSVIALNHDDVYSTMDHGHNLLLQLEYMADVVMKVEPLATGLATDVHGQLTVTNKGVEDDVSGKSRKKVHNFQFRIKDSGVEYFYPGSKGLK